MRPVVSASIVTLFGMVSARAQTGLDRKAIDETMGVLQDEVNACGAQVEFTGKVTVKATVNPDGTVKSIEDLTRNGSIRDRLGACVMGVVRDAKFPESAKGATFTYSFKVAPDVVDIPFPEEDALQPVQIAHALTRVKPTILACGDASTAGGTVTAKISVATDGTAKVNAGGSSDTTLNACVASAIETAPFDKPGKASTFSRSYVFAAALDATVASAGIAKLEATLKGCKWKVTALHPMGAKLDVGANGKVTAVAMTSSSGDAAHDACELKVLKTARFAKTTAGGWIRYPLPHAISTK